MHAGVKMDAMDKPSYGYILASAPYGTLYIGVTTDIVRRTWQHREALLEGFTKTYGVHRLVWYEVPSELMSAVTAICWLEIPVHVP